MFCPVALRFSVPAYFPNWQCWLCTDTASHISCITSVMGEGTLARGFWLYLDTKHPGMCLSGIFPSQAWDALVFLLKQRCPGEVKNAADGLFLGLQEGICYMCQLGCLIRTKYICDCLLTVLKAWECAPGGIGEEEMNTTNSPELDSKTEV